MPSLDSPTVALQPMAFSDRQTPMPGDVDVKKSELPEDILADGESATILTGRRLAIVFAAFCMSFFLVALDQTILSTALPTIASHFNAVDNISWIASAYFLPQAAFMLFFGKILAVLPAKAVFMVSVFVFELGSLFCAVSFSVEFLIFGRAVAGLGGTGMWASIMSIIARITTLETRPILLGLFGAVFAVSSIIGPIIGGAFSDHVTWRWCFYINLPIGGVALAIVFVVLPNLRVVAGSGKLTALMRLDWIGAILNFGFVTFLLIALQYGGNELPWDDGMVIAFLVLAAVFAIVFVLWERRAGPRAVLPLEVALRRNVLVSTVAAVFIFMSFVVFNVGSTCRSLVYSCFELTKKLPLFYQVKGHSATRSGIDILPFMISGVLATLVTGGVVSKTGFAWPFLALAPILPCVGFGILFTVDQGTSFGTLFGYQLLVGIGLGCVTTLPLVVAQAEFADREDLIPLATSFSTFGQLIGSSVGLAVSGAVFASQLKHELGKLALPSAELVPVLSSVKAIVTLPVEARSGVISAYIASIQRVFLIGIPATALALIVSLLLVKNRLNKTPGVV
ncbi:ABC transporter [Peniophora sp. CONT]|nr:ABC transporter [Peniophora sp. CONT]